METSQPQAAIPRSQLTAFDWIGIVLVAVVASLLFTVPIASAPTFEKMFREFSVELPPLTRLVLRPWFAIGGGLASLATCALAAKRSLSIAKRRLFIVLGFVVGLAAIALCLIGLYLPVFQLAGSIQ